MAWVVVSAALSMVARGGRQVGEVDVLRFLRLMTMGHSSLVVVLREGMLSTASRSTVACMATLLGPHVWCALPANEVQALSCKGAAVAVSQALRQ